MEPVSPELVLVDRALAERVLPWLREPDDTLARVEERVHASRRAALAQRSVEIPHQTQPRVVEPRPRIARPPSPRPRVDAAATCGVRRRCGGVHPDRRALARSPRRSGRKPGRRRHDRGRHRRAAYRRRDTTETQPSRCRTKPRRSRAPAEPTEPAQASRNRSPQPQRFAWAPVPDASAYHVELFLGSSRVFEGGHGATRADDSGALEVRGPNA